jgi:cyclopropane fatty-acyl-phospholipid synthase-like methyltransferase
MLRRYARAHPRASLPTRMPDLPYKDFYYPLNVFTHMILHEEGRVDDLHYGLFAPGETSMLAAQRRSTELLLSRLPAPPARLLEVGLGLGTTLVRLTDLGYDVVGITPDAAQIGVVRSRHGDRVRMECVRFENFDAAERFDCIFFQESSQYIGSEALFARSAALLRENGRVVVLDEFALKPVTHAGALHALSGFLDAASANAFRLVEEMSLSEEAAPTVDWFMQRIPAWRERLIAELALQPSQVDELLTSGQTYVASYRDGTYGYRLLVFER